MTCNVSVQRLGIASQEIAELLDPPQNVLETFGQDGLSGKECLLECSYNSALRAMDIALALYHNSYMH